MPLNQNKRILIVGLWDVSTIFEKSYACAFSSIMECYPARIGERQKAGVERRESHGRRTLAEQTSLSLH